MKSLLLFQIWLLRGQFGRSHFGLTFSELKDHFHSSIKFQFQFIIWKSIWKLYFTLNFLFEISFSFSLWSNKVLTMISIFSWRVFGLNLQVNEWLLKCSNWTISLQPFKTIFSFKNGSTFFCIFLDLEFTCVLMFAAYFEPKLIIFKIWVYFTLEKSKITDTLKYV